MSRDGQIIFKQLLQRHDRIQIPMIQRDYAQGRPEESAVRELFLMTLDEALRKPVDDATLPLNLDFIYGSVEEAKNKQSETKTRLFLPLDGQQRLTTLFLLHWYLAWRDEEWGVFEELFVADNHARFTYDVRPSSNEFFDRLVGYRPALRPDNMPNRNHPLSDLLTDQPWYFRSWRRDPTIQAVLHMLDAIHHKFASSTGLFARLIDDKHPAITFQLLNLENFGLSDDLYIKMNARGKPLTPFETFKARYEEELKSQFKGMTLDLAGHHFSVADYVARRMDTAWADLFWKLRDPDSHEYDEAFMNLARAVALVTRSPDDEEYLSDVTLLRSGREAPTYMHFHKHDWLDERFTLTLIHLLDSWSERSKDRSTLSSFLPDTNYFDEGIFFNEITSKGANLSYAEIVQFAAYVKFVDRYHHSIDAATFQEWMRIINNLATNTIYNRVEDFRRSIRGLDGLLEHADDILGHFARVEKVVAGFFEMQIAEEKLKAQLILVRNGWRELIDHAERHGYFRGQIGFLLDFCGAYTARNDSAPRHWNAVRHETLQTRFERYMSLAKKTFSATGLMEQDAYRWQRALLSIGNYLLPRGQNHSFLVNTVTDETSWKRLLRGTGTIDPEPREFLKELWDQLDPDAPLAPQLDRIIEARQELEPWREALVHCPQAFQYCGKNYVRNTFDTFYLLRKTQLNGYHAELFSYCLYQKSREAFAVLQPRYQEVAGLDSKPHLQLSCKLLDEKVTFFVTNKEAGFQIRAAKIDFARIEGLEAMLQSAGYTETNHFFQNWSSRSEIEAHLKAVDQALDSFKISEDT